MDESKLYCCEYCGFKFDDSNVFVRKRFFYLDSTKTYCKTCVPLAVDKSLQNYLLIKLLIISYAMYLYHIQGSPQFAWLLINIVLMGFLGFFLVSLHEMGHAVTARLLNMRLYGVTIGQGNPFYTFTFKGCPVTINKTPFMGGFTFVSFNDGDESLWKIRLVYLAGPAVNLFIFLLIFWLVGLDKLLHPVLTGFKGVEFFTILAFDNFINFVRNILPRTFDVNGAKFDSDGRLLLMSFFKKKKKLRELRIQSYLSQGMLAIEKTEYKKAEAYFEKGMANIPGALVLSLQYTNTLYLQKKYKDVYDYLVKLIDSDISSDEDKLVVAYLYNYYAWIIFFLQYEDKLAIADKYSKMALDMEPNASPVLDTRGCIEMETGDLESAKKHIYKAIQVAPVLSSKLSGLCVLLLIANKENNQDRVDFLYSIISSYDIEIELMLRIEKILT